MGRTTVFCIVEGQTENAVLKALIAPHLGELGVDFHVPIVRVGRGRGGVKFLEAADLFDQVRRLLKDPRHAHVTTFFDYYAFPESEARGWKFVSTLKAEAPFRGAEAVAELIEKEIHKRAVEGLELPNLTARLIPYIQLHELEALFFAEPDKTAATLGNPSMAKTFAQTVEQCGGCERIDDRPQTAPSKRIELVFPWYVKGRSERAHGPRIAEKLELATVRDKCPRFNSWVAKLEALRPPLP
jgi:hypothetical protein